MKSYTQIALEIGSKIFDDLYRYEDLDRAALLTTPRYGGRYPETAVAVTPRGSGYFDIEVMHLYGGKVLRYAYGAYEDIAVLKTWNVLEDLRDGEDLEKYLQED